MKGQSAPKDAPQPCMASAATTAVLVLVGAADDAGAAAAKAIATKKSSAQLRIALWIVPDVMRSIPGAASGPILLDVKHF